MQTIGCVLMVHLHGKTNSRLTDQCGGHDRFQQYPDTSGHHAIDLELLLKSSRILSSEIILETLIEKLMEIVFGNVGVTKGYLYVIESKQLFLLNGDEIRCSPILKSTEEEAPIQLLQYIQRNQEPLILHHECEEGMFKNDLYVQKNRINSIICNPLLNQDFLVGIIYFENNLKSHAFTEKDLLLISVLASQAAISIQNALLYINLERKLKEKTAELEKVNLNLEKANKELANAEKTRMELIANISHDLRNPLTSIQGYIEAMLDGVLISPDKQITYLQRSKEKIYALNRLIHHLYELSKLQYGTSPIVKEIVIAEKLFHFLCDLHEEEIKQHGLFFSRTIIQPQDEMNPLVEIDTRKIEQVFSTIISNSLRSTDEGEIAAKLHIDESKITVEISDTGEGIASSEVDMIFERSYIGTTKTSSAAYGLGLSICKEIILHHQGEIWAESFQGKGTTICFSIPILSLESALLAELDEDAR